MTRFRKWEQTAVKHPGATREYIKKAYGSAGFNADGTIKMGVLEEAIRRAKASGNTRLEKRLVLARTYKLQDER